MALIEPIYYAVFYDVEKPKTFEHAMNKRIEKKHFANLVDGIENKEVLVGDVRYKLISIQTFNIYNTVDNHLFVICEVKKIEENEDRKSN